MRYLFGVFLCLCLFSLATPAQGTTAPTTGPRYGDTGYVGKRIDFDCNLCSVANLLQSLTGLGGVQADFPDEDKWRRVAETVHVKNEPWNEAFDALLLRHQLQATWSPGGKLVIGSRGKAALPPSRVLSDLFEGLPPIPERIVGFSNSARAIEGDRFFREGISSFALCNSNDDRTALTRFAWSVQLFENVEYRGRQASALNFMGLCLLNLNRPDEASRAFTQAAELAKLVGNQRSELLANLCLTRIAIDGANRPENAEAIADEANRFVKDLNSRTNLVKPTLIDRSLEALVSVQAGRIYFLLGKYEKAVEPLLYAFGIAKVYEDNERTQVESLVLLERVTARAGRKAESQKFIEFLRIVERSTNSPRLRISIKFWAGTLYGQFGEQTRALDWFQEALAGLRQYTDTGLEIAVNREVGRAYVALKKFTEARRFYEAALRLAEQSNDDNWKRRLVVDMKQLP